MTARTPASGAVAIIGLLLLPAAASAQTATLRQRAENARTVLQREATDAEQESALATLRELFERRHDAITDVDTATAIVLAIGSLFEAGDPAASEGLERAFSLHDEHRLHQLTSWITGLRVFSAATPGDAIQRLLDAIPTLQSRTEHRVPDTEAQIGRFVIDLCCEEWRLADAETVLTWMRGLPPLVGAVHELVAGEVASAEFRVLLLRGEPERALAFLDQTAVHLAKAEANAPDLRAHLYANHTIDRTRYLLGNDQFGAAVTQIDELLQQTDHAPEVVAQLQLARGLALAASGQPDAADEQLAAVAELTAVSTSDRLRALMRRARIAIESGRGADAAGHLEEARGMLAAAADPIALDVRAAMHGLAVQLQRADKSPDPVQVRAARDELASILEQLLAHVDRTAVEFGGIGFLHFEDAHQILADRIDAELTLADDDRGRERAVELLLQAQAHGSLSRAFGATPALADVRAALPADGGALAFVPSWRGSHLFAIDRTGITHVRLGPRDALARTAKNLAGRLLQPGGDDALVAAARTACGELLPAPALAAIGTWKTVVICGTETLGQLPFEALWLPDGTMLGETKAIANVSALTLLPRLLVRRQQVTRMQSIGFVGQLAPPAAVLAALQQHPVAIPDSMLAPLLQPFPKASRQVLTDADATPTALAGMPFDQLDVVHILAHGFSDRTRRFGHGIALGQDEGHADGLLWPEAVLGWKIRGLWILSACNAGRAPRRVGEDHGANFGGALLHAGAHGVIQARGMLVTADLLPLLAALHRELAAGTNVAEALRRARCDGESPSLASRFHAAQLQLFGAWR